MAFWLTDKFSIGMMDPDQRTTWITAEIISDEEASIQIGNNAASLNWSIAYPSTLRRIELLTGRKFSVQVRHPLLRLGDSLVAYAFDGVATKLLNENELKEAGESFWWIRTKTWGEINDPYKSAGTNSGYFFLDNFSIKMLDPSQSPYTLVCSPRNQTAPPPGVPSDPASIEHWTRGQTTWAAEFIEYMNRVVPLYNIPLTYRITHNASNDLMSLFLGTQTFLGAGTLNIGRYFQAVAMAIPRAFKPGTVLSLQDLLFAPARIWQIYST